MARRSSKARRHPKAKPQGILELSAQGFGFVKTAEGEFFVPASKVNGAFPGDLVEVSRISNQAPDKHYFDTARKPSARVARVIMRARDTLIGRYEIAEPFGVVVPEDPSVPCDIFTLRSDAPHVNDGDLVEVRINEFPTRNSAATGTVVRVLGSEGDSDIAIDLIISNILLAMGMMMVSPMTISLPFKLLLFVTLDGWLKISQGLLLSYK